MKRIFLFLVPIMMIVGAITLFNKKVYIGNVIGNIEVSKPYRYGNISPYNYIDISFEYKTLDGKMYSEVLTRKDKYFLQNTTQGQLLSQGKVYETPWWFKLITFLLIIGAMLCHSYAEDLCYFVNTQFNIPTKPIKNFFGY